MRKMLIGVPRTKNGWETLTYKFNQIQLNIFK